jgi:hypothetical protein
LATAIASWDQAQQAALDGLEVWHHINILADDTSALLYRVPYWQTWRVLILFVPQMAKRVGAHLVGTEQALIGGFRAPDRVGACRLILDQPSFLGGPFSVCHILSLSHPLVSLP